MKGGWQNLENDCHPELVEGLAMLYRNAGAVSNRIKISFSSGYPLYLRYAPVPLLSGSLWAEGILFSNDLRIN